MKAVQPIRNYETIQDIMDYLKARSDRNYVLFCFGIHIPVRISDILPLKVRDVKGDYITIEEKKTSKSQELPINSELRSVIDEYIKDMRNYEYLFQSTKKNQEGYYTPISRQQAYNILNQAAKAFGLKSIGCHTMRKTFGYHYYQQTKDAVQLKEILNHTDVSETLRYIGLTQGMKIDAIKGFKYKRDTER